MSNRESLARRAILAGEVISNLSAKKKDITQHLRLVGAFTDADSVVKDIYKSIDDIYNQFEESLIPILKSMESDIAGLKKVAELMTVPKATRTKKEVSE